MSGEELKPWEQTVTEEEFREGNRKLVEEFRANGGKVGGEYEGSNLLLLTAIGARSGRRHTVPLAYQAEGTRLFVSFFAERPFPAWYYNLLANPTVTVEAGTETFEATASIATGEERARLWEMITQQWPWLAEHQETTTLQVPLIILQR